MVRSSDDDDGESEFGSIKNRELKGYTAGLHSPWGIIGHIAKERGLTKKQVLWGDTWLNYSLYASDAPRYMRGRKPAPVVDNLEDLRKLRGE